jgi:mannitol/fructose-specific phosphotransferase system IIA component
VAHPHHLHHQHQDILKSHITVIKFKNGRI